MNSSLLLLAPPLLSSSSLSAATFLFSLLLLSLCCVSPPSPSCPPHPYLRSTSFFSSSFRSLFESFFSLDSPSSSYHCYLLSKQSSSILLFSYFFLSSSSFAPSLSSASSSFLSTTSPSSPLFTPSSSSLSFPLKPPHRPTATLSPSSLSSSSASSSPLSHGLWPPFQHSFLRFHPLSFSARKKFSSRHDEEEEEEENSFSLLSFSPVRGRRRRFLLFLLPSFRLIWLHDFRKKFSSFVLHHKGQKINERRKRFFFSSSPSFLSSPLSPLTPRPTTLSSIQTSSFLSSSSSSSSLSSSSSASCLSRGGFFSVSCCFENEDDRERSLGRSGWEKREKKKMIGRLQTWIERESKRKRGDSRFFSSSFMTDVLEAQERKKKRRRREDFLFSPFSSLLIGGDGVLSRRYTGEEIRRRGKGRRRRSVEVREEESDSLQIHPSNRQSGREKLKRKKKKVNERNKDSDREEEERRKDEVKTDREEGKACRKHLSLQALPLSPVEGREGEEERGEGREEECMLKRKLEEESVLANHTSFNYMHALSTATVSHPSVVTSSSSFPCTSSSPSSSVPESSSSSSFSSSSSLSSATATASPAETPRVSSFPDPKKALKELERYEKIRDENLLMSWEAWARGVSRSVEYLKRLVTLAYSPSKEEEPTSSLEKGGEADKEEELSSSSFSPFLREGQKEDEEEREKRMRDEEEGDIRKDRMIMMRKEEERGEEKKKKEEEHEEKEKEEEGEMKMIRGMRSRERVRDRDGVSRLEESSLSPHERKIQQGEEDLLSISSSHDELTTSFPSLQGEEEEEKKKKSVPLHDGSTPQEKEEGKGERGGEYVSLQASQRDERQLLQVSQEIKGFSSSSEGEKTKKKPRSSNGEEEEREEEKSSSMRASFSSTSSLEKEEEKKKIGQEKKHQIAKPPRKQEDGEEDEEDEEEEGSSSRWEIGNRLVTKKDYKELLDLLRIEAVHSALEGSEKEEPLSFSSSSSPPPRRPPTVEEWSRAATGGDIELLSLKLSRCRHVLDQCLRKLVPLAVVAVRRFRAASIYAYQKKKMLEEQGDYDAIKALMEKRNEEETELLLIALQGLRTGLRRHARTSLRNKVKWMKERQTSLQGGVFLLPAEKEERDAPKEPQEDREEQQEEEDREEGEDELLHSVSLSHLKASTSPRDTPLQKNNALSSSPHLPLHASSSSSVELRSLPELSPPPSIAYWLWMRTAMIEWEQEKRLVSHFPWKWWRDAAKGRKVAHALYEELGREPTESEVAEKLGMSVEKWRDISLATRSVVSAETEISSSSGGGSHHDSERRDTLGDLLLTSPPTSMIEGEQKEYREELETHVLDLARKALTPHEYTLIRSLLISKPSTPFATPPAMPSSSSSASSRHADGTAKEKRERKIGQNERIHRRDDREKEAKEENRDYEEEEDQQAASHHPAVLRMNEEHRYPTTTTIDSSRLQRLIQKMKEYEVKKIIENLSPEEKKEGLKNLQSLENIVKKKSVVLQLCTAATAQQGYED
ncbi:sigma- region 3 protein [Cystoisospora suis]|uniref:Sigma-region 3 protein n=1 Tax=Cystoisospora suis TaxID=483139 RepID=A0A2C6KBE7_9APIC|nr:sigma- region 3 protein [Cystoisospora suis]